MHARPPWVGLGDAAHQDNDDSALQQQQRRPGGGAHTQTRVTPAAATAAAHVDAYLEYVRVVGDADGGRLFTEEEYEQFKRLQLAERSQRRLYVTWRNGQGLDCKAVGPASLCECGHRYREHANDTAAPPQPPGQKLQRTALRCRAAGCGCRAYQYLPSAGAWHAKCGCKHGSVQHDASTKACTRCGCTAFHATFSCSCGQLWAQHATRVETRQQRLDAGRPVDNLAGGGTGYAALGGVTDFSSLTDAYRAAEHGLAAVPPPPAGTDAVVHATTDDAEGTVPSNDALLRLKSARARARGAAPPANSDGASPASSASHVPAMTYKEKRRLAAEAASAAAAARRAAQVGGRTESDGAHTPAD